MCFCNGIQYSCPGEHILLNTINPFTLCEFAQHHPIPHQCGNVIHKFEKSEEWCIDCWTQEHDGQEGGKKDVRVWDDRWAGGAKWTGYGGDRGKDAKKDDVPQ